MSGLIEVGTVLLNKLPDENPQYADPKKRTSDIVSFMPACYLLPLQSNIFAKTKISETVFACSYGAQVESFKQQQKWSKISRHCPFDACTSTYIVEKSKAKIILGSRRRNKLFLF